jgi:integrase
MEDSLESSATTWDDILAPYTDYLTSGTLSPRTVKLRLYHLDRIRRHIGKEPGDITLDDLTGYFKDRDWAPNTRAVVRASMAVFFRFAHGTGRIPSNPALQLPPIRVPGGKPKPASDEAVSGALASADPRVHLMVTLGMKAGLRAMEIACS